MLPIFRAEPSGILFRRVLSSGLTAFRRGNGARLEISHDGRTRHTRPARLLACSEKWPIISANLRRTARNVDRYNHRVARL